MHRAMLVGSGFLVGALATFALGQCDWTLAGRDETTLASGDLPAESTPPRRPTPSVPPSRATAITPPECEACLGEVQRLELENGVLRQQVTTLGGARAEWPADPGRPFEPDALKAWLQGMPTHGLELAELDCDEFPCIAAFRVAEGQPLNARRIMAPMIEGLAEHSAGTSDPRIAVFPGDHGGFAALSLGPRGLDQDASGRLDVRMKEIADRHLE